VFKRPDGSILEDRGPPRPRARVAATAA
jgi:hypothetical protein